MKKPILLHIGFTLLEIMIVVAIIGILLAIAGPTWFKQREQSRGKACSENLQKIEGAIEQWALEYNIRNDADAEELSTYVGATSFIKRSPLCPASGTYDTGKVGGSPTCDYYGSNWPKNLHTLGS